MGTEHKSKARVKKSIISRVRGIKTQLIDFGVNRTIELTCTLPRRRQRTWGRFRKAEWGAGTGRAELQVPLSSQLHINAEE
jgi:hypothetical protein